MVDAIKTTVNRLEPTKGRASEDVRQAPGSQQLYLPLR